MDVVTSADGARIAYEKSGMGPPLVLVHGSLNDHNVWAAVTPMFAKHHCVYAVVRRGRGESGAPAEHALEREFEDVAAVIDSAGEPVDLVGHSYGAHCALGAALMMPDRVKHLVLYEPPTREQAIGLADDFERSEPAGAISSFFERSLGMSAAQVGAMKASPFWPYFVSHAPSMPSEMRALEDSQLAPSRLAALKMPALLVVGSETRDRLGGLLRELEPHLPRAEWAVLVGQGHAAMLQAPDLFVATVEAFLTRVDARTRS